MTNGPKPNDQGSIGGYSYQRIESKTDPTRQGPNCKKIKDLEAQTKQQNGGDHIAKTTVYG